MPLYQSGAVLNRRSAFHQHPDGTLGVREASFTWPVNAVNNDVVEMIPVNPGERVIDVQIGVEATPEGGAQKATLEVGDGDDTDRYIGVGALDAEFVKNGGWATIPTSGSFAVAMARNHTYDDEDTIDVRVAAAPTAGARGRIFMRALVIEAGS